MSAACAFLSHPAQGDREAIPLHEHLAKVAGRAKGVAGRMSPDAAGDAFVAGLLHDIGKLSPWYQRLFAGEGEDGLYSKYGPRQHSPFSAWAALHLLFGKPYRHHVVHSVAGHHSGLSTRLHTPKDPRAAVAQKEMLPSLKEFSDYVRSGPDPESEAWRDMDWEGCMESFGVGLNFGERVGIDGEADIGTYLHTKCVFSALLQADRGSFHDIPERSLSMGIQPTHSGDPDSKVGSLRKSFQDAAFESYLQSASERVVVIEAPTGAGKTDLIFRILGHHAGQGSHDRAFYFSPLLALTDGFIAALMGGGAAPRPAVPKESDRDLVLEYNHMTAEPISGRGEGGEVHDMIARREQSNAEQYEASSFGYPFVVSTTARLLLTIYGNLASSCIKFASLANSVIIVDEIQTIPKFLLKSLIKSLSWIAKSSGSRVILVSATIPGEITGMGIREIRCDERVAGEFVGLTSKTLSVAPSLDIGAVRASAPAMTAVIFNTRPAASKFYHNARTLRDRYGEIVYLTSGIRKRDRLEHIRRIATAPRPEGALVVSTQVLEAGVDASFGRMFREMAPLDSIVQAMGRLNRHGGSESAEITVFGRDPPQPYRQIEICETQKVLDALVANGPVTSAAVYASLREYYGAVASGDAETQKNSEDLEHSMSRHDYDRVWGMVHKGAFADYNVNVFLPYPNGADGAEPEAQFDSLFAALNDMDGHGGAGRRRSIMRRAARMSAALPASSLGKVSGLLDPALLERGICVPRDSESLDKIYDPEIGLDRWVGTGGTPC